MARTFIDYKEGKGFEINEAYIQLAFCYTYQEVKKAQYNFSNKQELLGDFEDKINGYRNGYLILGWDEEVITSQIEEQTLLQALQNVKITLQSKENNIPAAQSL